MSHPDPAVEHLVRGQAVHDLVNRSAAGVDDGDVASVISHATRTHHGHHPDGSVWC